MQYLGIDKPSLDEVVEHVGVKGMRWGVRRQKRLDRLNRVASGTGNKRDTVNVALTEVSARTVRKEKGYAGAASKKANIMEDRKRRIKTGEVRVRDLLRHYGGDRITDY